MKKRRTKEMSEREIVESYEKGEWRSVPRLKEEMARYRTYAQAHMIKNKRINIRLSEHDVEGIRRIAMSEGIPYQTLITSIIHKYVTGAQGR